MAKKDKHVSATPATQWLERHGVAFTEHPYDYVEHGGTAESARQLGVDEHAVVKTLVMRDERAQPLLVLMHGDKQVSTKNLARAIGCKSVEPCKPEEAQRHSGYLVGGTSPFGFKKQGVAVYVEASVLEQPRIFINGGRRGYLVGIEPGVLTQLLGAATLATWVIIAAFFRYSSLASLAAAAFAPFYQLLIWDADAFALAIFVMSLLLVWRHSANIAKLIAGTESKLGQKARTR